MGDFADDPFKVLFETHVEHSVSLVENEVGDSPQVGVSRFQKV